MKELPFFKNNEEKNRKGFMNLLKENPSLSEEDRRKAELEFLTPHKNPDPTKERTFTKPRTKINVETYIHKIMLYFHKEEDYQLFRKYVKVNDYIESNTYDMKLITAFFTALEKGTIKVLEDAKGQIILEQGGGMKTLPCKICGRLYTDNITEKVNPDKGGYIICSRCAMIDPTAEKEEEKEEKIVWKKKKI